MIARPARFTPSQIAEATGAPVHEAQRAVEFAGLATDTRDPLENTLFVALTGARFDAHNFLRNAVDAGATGLLVSQEGFRRVGGRQVVGQGVSVFQVPDVLSALGDLARFHRRRSPAKVIALTGSNGKTTTKEILAAVAGVEHRVLATHANLNNLIGLPLTLLGLDDGHELCVAEMGMNAPGEIARMVEIAEPDVGVVTNIGPAHIGELGSIEAIAEAKGEMFDGLGPGAIAVANRDDARVMGQLSTGARTFGFHPDADVCVHAATSVGEAQQVTLTVDGAECAVELPLAGRHNVINLAAALAAVTAGSYFDVDLSRLHDAWARIERPSGRLEVFQVGPIRIVNDAYNANEDSARVAIESMAQLASGRWLAAMGEMKELGSFSEKAHASVGRALAAAGAAVIASFGAEAEPIARAAADDTVVRHEAEDFQELSNWLVEQLRPGDTLLIKGSRSSQMERMIQVVRARFEPSEPTTKSRDEGPR